MNHARRRGTAHTLISLFLVVLFVCSAALPVQAMQVEIAPVVYSIIDIGPLAHPDQDNCFDQAPGATVNDVGVGNRAVGSVYVEGERAVAALLSSSGPRKMVSGAGGGRANAINSVGQIAGTVFSELPAERCGDPGGPLPATWSSGFDIELLPLPEGATAGSAEAINRSGVIAGWVETSAGRRASVWIAQEPIVIQHASIPGATGLESEAVSVNDDGIVAGTVRWFENGARRSLAFTWNGRSVQYLEPYGGTDGVAWAINNAGAVAGSIVTESGVRQPVLWWRGQLVALDPLADRPHAEVTDINNAGLAVGFGERDNGLTRAMIWIAGELVDLNEIVSEDSGWQLQMAVGINDDGVIAGWGDLDGERRAFLLAPAAG